MALSRIRIFICGLLALHSLCSCVYGEFASSLPGSKFSHLRARGKEVPGRGRGELAHEHKMEKRLPQEGASNLEQDKQILLDLMKGFSVDPFGALSNWDSIRNPCEWSGVGCSGDTAAEARVVSLELKFKMLEGEILPAIGGLSELRELVLLGNRLYGRIPREISRCSKLAVLDLEGNQLSGTIPHEFASFRSLEVLKLSANNLSGTLEEVFSSPNLSSVNSFVPFQRLKILDASFNLLSGKLPPELGMFSSLEEIRLDGNQLVGTIPESIGSLTSLLSLSLNDNLLDGELPPSLTRCNRLQFLDVSDNSLTGCIPPSFAKVPGLRLFNVSNNQLKGAIPQGRWFRYGVYLDAFSGNPALCGYPLQPCSSGVGSLIFRRASHAFFSFWPKISDLFIAGRVPKKAGRRTRMRILLPQNPAASLFFSPAPAPAPAFPNKGHKKGPAAERWLLGLTMGMVSGGLSALAVVVVFRSVRNWYRNRPKYEGPIVFHRKLPPKLFVFLEKEQGLEGAELVGQGGAGQVFKVCLENGKIVAVKKMAPHLSNNLGSPLSHSFKLTKNSKQIQAELKTLGLIRHRNLVSLLAYIPRPEFHLLIYDFMPNGSLHDALRKAAEGALELTWPMRHKIAVGTALGLTYLHFHCTPRIVHRDLKPANILLDEDYEPHVGDFGLAKVLPDSFTHVTSSNVAGTVGYIAPEYHQTMRYTDKSDVYSFGVVLAVLLTGKDPTNEMFLEVANMGKWIYDHLQSGTTTEIFDRQLRDKGVDEQLTLALRVAFFCTQDTPSERPSSQDALSMLRQIP